MIQATTKDAMELVKNGLISVSKASLNGIPVDVKYCQKQDKILDLKIKKLINKFKKTKTGRLWKKIYRNPNFNSDLQLRNILFSKLKIPVVKLTEPSTQYPKGQPSVDNETLEIIKKEIPDLEPYLLYKKYDKVKNTYINGILKEQVNGILHPFTHLHLASTFRSSMSYINFQNQPNRDPMQKKIIRSAFIPFKKWQLITGDFKGIEVGVSCCNHKDPKMIKYVKDPKTDMHRDLAIDCYLLDSFEGRPVETILRKGAKNGFVFPQFYGDYYRNNAPVLCNWGKLPIQGSFLKKDGLLLPSGVSLGEHLMNKGIYDFEDYVEHIQKVERHFWTKRFKRYNQWKINNVEEYFKKGHLNTLTGFTCSGIMSKNQINNYPIQGPAFHCTLRVFNEMTRRMEKQKLESKLIGQIHDEIVVNCYPPEKGLILEMFREVACVWIREQWDWIIVPFEIEAAIYGVDESWASKPEKMKLAA